MMMMMMMMINCSVIWLTNYNKNCLALFPAGIIARDTPYHESPTRCEQDFNLCKTLVQAWLNEVVL